MFFEDCHHIAGAENYFTPVLSNAVAVTQAPTEGNAAADPYRPYANGCFYIILLHVFKLASLTSFLSQKL